nr:IgGFc-binding protein [Macaca nemestrina]
MGALWSWWILWAGATLLWGLTQEASVDLKNTGRNEFLTAFLQNYQLAYSKAYPRLLISSLSESPASVFILSQADKTSHNVTVRPGESVMVNMSAKAEMIGSKIFQHAVVIHSDHAISVQALNAKPDTAELTLLRPIQALGTEYFVLTPPGTSARNVKEFAVVAGATGASVSVTLKGSVTFNGKFYPAGDVLSVTLEPYNVAQLQSSLDLSGSKVTASSPVAVLSGHSCAQKHTTCNHVVEQLLPTSAWGTHYVVPTLASQSRYDLAFVMASQTTKLTYNHGGITGSRGLQAGDVVEFEVRPSRPLYLSANVGIQVLLFGTGAIRNEVTYDPYLVLIPDVAAYCPAYVVKSVPGSEGVALVVAQTKAISGLTIDGHAVGAKLTWAAVPGSEFSYAEVELGTADTIHTAEATTNFGLLTFGLAKATGYATAADCGRTVVSPAKPSCEGVQCAAGQRCQVAGGKAKCVAESTAVCRAQGDPHYTTFDGRRYDMMGTCSYTMAELCGDDETLPAFSVEAKNEHRGSRRVSYVGLVTVHAYSHSVSLTRGEVGFVLVDKQRSRLPVSLSEGRLRVYQSGPRAVVELVFGLVVTYDWDCQLALSLPARFQDQVCGLCGNYNGDPADDFLLPDGVLAPDPVEFASSWKLDDGDYLCEDGCQNNCPACTPGQAQHYEGDRLCGMLTKLDGPFAVCHGTLDPRSFLEQCVYDLCVVGGERLSLCRGLSAYAQACLELGISVGNWRPLANCPLSCPANSRYELCGPACPASCNEAAAPSNCSGRPCVEGCVCLPGFVASGGTCVPASSCGCTFQGLQLAPGQEVWADESCRRRCTCNGATHQVTCRDTQGCPAGEICSDQNGLLGCYPNRFGTCQGSGDPHYVSFDGRRFDFMGTCTYLLVGSCGQNAALPAFRVLVENEHRGSQTVSYTRAVRVEARGVKVVVRREYPGQVLVDDVLQYLPFQAADGQVQVFRQGRDAVVRTDFGLTVTYNWDARVTAKVPSSYAEALCGLCGNFNGDPADDLALRGGGQAANALAFGNSWQEETRSGCGAAEPGDCPKLDSLVAQQLQSKNECGILADPQGPFRECHSKLDPQGAVRDCVYDRCLLPGQSGPLCDALATYAAACQAAGATVHPWRSEKLCPLSCPPNSHYEACSYGCPLSCGDLPVHGGCGSECHEGCVCDEGFALSGESCLPLASCGCVHQGTYYPPGQTFYPGPGCDSLCHCQEGGLVSCEPSSCGPHEACQPSGGSLGCVAVGSATCQASGDPHYTTFDGRRFDFMGTCVYVLAQTCGTRPGLHRFAVLQENVAWGNGRVSVTRVITVQVGNFTLRLEQRQWKVTVNGVDMKLPVVLANGQIRASQHGSDVVIETDFGLRVAYDLVYYVRVTIPGNYYQQMCGLCGNYNGDPKDDFQKPNGSQAGNANDFGNSWEEAVPGSPCLPPPTCPPGSEGCDTSKCPPEQEKKYEKEEFCGLLSSATGPLASCHKLVDPQGPLQDCVFDLCLGGGNLSILCNNIHAYVSACQAAGGHVKPWRTETFCPMKCPANSHYELCADTCSLGCAALSAPLQCPDECAEGCQCDAGFLYNGEACVPIQQCGCYHNGVYYEPEQTVLIDDCRQQCTCHVGKGVLCQEHSCPPGQVCQPSGGVLSCITKDPCDGVTCRPQETCKEQGGQGVCVPNYEATCWLWGDPHYHSFDGRAFDFQGTCNYVLATTGCPGVNTQGLTPFTVTTKNENRGNPAVSYVRVVTVAALGTNISIHKGEIGKVRVCVAGWSPEVPGRTGGILTTTVSSSRLLVFTWGNGVDRTARVLAPWSQHVQQAAAADCVAPPGLASCGRTTLCTNVRVPCRNDYATRLRCVELQRRTPRMDSRSQWPQQRNAMTSGTHGEEAVPKSGREWYKLARSSQPFLIFAGNSYIILNVTFKRTATYISAGLATGNDAYRGVKNGRDEVAPDAGMVWTAALSLADRPDAHSLIDPTVDMYVHCAKGVWCQGEPAGRRTGVPASGGRPGCINRKMGFWVNMSFGDHHSMQSQTLLLYPFHKYETEGLRGEDTQFFSIRHGLELGSDPTQSLLSEAWPASLASQVNGVDMKLPVVLANGQIRASQHGSDVVIETDFGLRVAYDLVYYVRVTIPGNYYQLMCGLCGNYNGDPKDDFQKPNGSQAGNANDFGNSWEEAVPGSPCLPPPTCPPGSEGCDTSKCPPEQEKKYEKEEFCGLLSSATGPLASCHKLVDPQGPLQDCVFDLCLGGGNLSILCSNIHAYVSACQAAGGHVKPWRTETFCPMKCPANSHYELCADTCSLGCAALSAPLQCPDGCAEGCQCDAGFLYNGEACVPIQQCGCYHNGVYYEPEQTVLIDDCRQQCTCHVRKGVLCQEHSCPPGQVCQPSGGVLSCITKDPCDGVTCRPQETCKEQGGQGVCVPNYEATCWLWGDPHYHSFDGRAFDFQGTCNYVLATTGCPGVNTQGLTPFTVTTKNENRGNPAVSYVRVVTVAALGTNISIHKGEIGKVRVNGVLTALPVSEANGRISVTHGASKALLVADFGLQVSYDWNWRVDVTLPSSYHGAVCGLCGNMDRNPNNDQAFPNGTLAPSIPIWGGSWRVPGWDPLCWDVCPGSCPTCPEDKLEQYEGPGFCGPLVPGAGGPFATCHAHVPPESFFKGCVLDVCMGGGAHDILCKALASYVAACQAAGVVIEDWRAQVGCEITCPENSHYEVCGPPCPASCPSPAPPATPAVCEGPCVEGCQCDAGFVLSADRCVSLNNSCGCWANGTYHEAGSEFWADGTCSHRCRCGPGGGSLVCTPASCGLGEVCGLLPSGQHGCQPVSTAECQAWGDPHYVTLDGHRFDFQGNCEYLLSAPCHGPPSGAANFTVTVANEHRGSQAVSYTRSVTLQIYNHSLTLSARWPRQLQVDGVFVALPFQLDSLLHAHLSGADVVVTTTSGLSLTFDGDSFVRLRVPAAYAGALCGLCGNYNQDPADDLKAVDGKPAGWQVGGAPGCGECVSGPCPSQCTPEQQESFGGPDACGVISATDGPLAPCHCLVPPAQYFQGCLLDACQVQGHPGGLCPAVAAYVAACQAAGAQLGEWRRPDFCPFQCPAHSHYELCGDSCPVSCPSLSAPEGCESACREGCVCDAGFVLSGDTCVPVGQCGCLYDGRYYPLGEAFYPGPECERRCECGPGGHVTCQEGAACGPHEECRLEDGVRACHATGCGRCLANGGIHYVTLDGRVFDLHGSCSYVLAQVCQPKPGDEDFSIVLEKNAAGDPQRLLVTVSGQVVSLAQGQQVTVDGEAVALPVAVGRVRVTAEGRNMVLQTTKGLRLLFDGDAQVLMSVPSSFRGRLCGLCGNFNGNWSDDFVLPNGLAASSVETFGAAWRAPGSSKGCGEGCGPQGCPVCSAEETAPYESNKACGQLRNPQGPFATCQAVLSPSEYFRQCVYDLCAQKGDTAFLCRSLAAYTAACQAAGVAVKPWRTDSFCPLQCPAHSHYSICTHTCQGSCAALSGLTGCTTRCFEGCECDDRFLLSQGVCIPVQDCGCTHNGRYLPVNSSLLTSDCSKLCSCSSSSGLTCQAAGCPPGRVCEVKAEARQCWAARGLCVLSVGANLTTFDGARGATTSPGVYELSSRCPGLQKTIPWYRVVAEVQTCHGKTEAVGQIHIFFEDGMVTVTPNKGVWVNGLRVDLPAEKLASVSMSRTPDGSLLVRQKAGVQVWLGANGKLAVMVSEDHAGKLCGACGNFDGDQTNDWRDSEGKSVMEKWRAQDFSPCYG